MPEDNNDDGNDQGGTDTKTLRGKLEAALSRIEKLETDKTKAERQLAISQSGLKDLSPRRQRIIMRELEEDRMDFTPENIREVAVDLGYAKSDDFKDGAKSGEQNGQDNGQQATDQNGQQQGTPPPYGRYPTPDQRMDSMSGLHNQGMPRASQITSAEQFSQALDAAQSAAEVDAIIRQSGGQFGVALEEDMM